MQVFLLTFKQKKFRIASLGYKVYNKLVLTLTEAVDIYLPHILRVA